MPHRRLLLVPVLSLSLAVACSDSDPEPEESGLDAGGTTGDAGATGDGGIQGDSGSSLGGPLMYTGGFTTGSTIEPRHMCLSPIGGGEGENVSPPLEWTGGPSETQSFAVVLYDTTYSTLHWVVWDIPATATALPEGLAASYELTDPDGAHQASPGGNEYFGPCSSGAIAGTYEYRLYALEVDSLDVGEDTSVADVQAAVEAAALDEVIWAGSPE